MGKNAKGETIKEVQNTQTKDLCVIVKTDKGKGDFFRAEAKFSEKE